MQNLKTRLNLADIFFFVLWITTQYFTRNVFCQIMMVLFCGVVILYLLKKPFSKMRTTYFFWNLLFIGYGLVQILTHNVIDDSVATSMVRSLFLNWIMVYAIVQYILWQKNLRSFLKMVEWGTFVVAVVTITISLPTLVSGRLGSETEINANMLAMLCVYSMVLCWYLMQGAEKKTGYKVKIVFYIATILLTGSRKGLLMILIAILVVNALQGQRKFIKSLFITLLVGAALLFLVMNVDFLYDIIGSRVENLFDFLTEGSTEEGSLTTRNDLVERGMELVRLKPWTGYGYDCFKVVSGIGWGEGFFLYSHNNYIELLFSGGIIGLVLYYIPIAMLLIGLFKNRKKDPCIIYMIAILVSKLAIEYAYISYYERIDAYWVAIMLGCLVFVRNQTSNDLK